MFIRWKRRQEEATGRWIKIAYLIGSVRTADGPRPPDTWALAWFYEGEENQNLRHRDVWPLHWFYEGEENQAGPDYFWFVAEQVLKRHTPPEDRARLIAELERVIPRPAAGFFFLD